MEKESNIPWLAIIIIVPIILLIVYFFINKKDDVVVDLSPDPQVIIERPEDFCIKNPKSCKGFSK